MTGALVTGEMELDTNTPNSEGWTRGRHRNGEAQRGSVGSAWEAKGNFPKERSYGLGFEASIEVYQVEK